MIMKRLFLSVLISLCVAQCLFAEKPTKVNHNEWSRNAVIYEVNIRQYTPEGTFNAFTQHLQRLKSLGVNILWIMPINPISLEGRQGTLGSYYAVQNYTQVNPEFGTLADFKSLVDKAHSLGMKVILDWVANHTGLDNVWVKAHPDYYVKDSVGAMIHPYNWNDTYKLDYTNKNLRRDMIDAMEYWLKETNIDGFRCDVAMEVPTDFWNDARQEFDKIKPVFMLAEAEKPDLTQAAFDMCYNWPLKNLMADIAKKGVHAQFSLDSLKAHQDSVFPQGAYLMNHITNHDLNSWEGTEFDRLGDGVKAFAVLEYTWPGMPLIYTGQEVGLNRAIKFFEKDKAPDFTNNEWTVFYKQLNVLKHSYPALRAGDGAPVVRFPATNSQVYIFSRSDKRNTILVMLNLSPKEAAVKFTSKAPKGLYHDYFKGKNAKAESVPTTLKAWEYKIFVK